MLRLVVLSLILACVVSLSSSVVVLENDKPLYWAEAFSQATEVPKQDEKLGLSAWHFLHRMSFYRLIITATDPFMGSMGTNATDSPVWGLPVQLAWLLKSGRLADPTDETTCGQQTGDTMCISPKSWWGCVNYFTSALPFLSAVEQGFMGPGLQGLNASTDSPLPDNEKRDSLLGLYWAAQMESTYASAVCNSKQSYYSSEEISFATSWLNSAEYVSAAHFHSNLEKSVKFITPLPGRVLKNGDVAPTIADMSQEENHTLYVFAWMKNINTLLGGTLLRLWRSAMCSVTTREKGREMLERLLLDSSYVKSSFLSIITGMTTSC